MRRWTLPLSRDEIILILAAVNQVFLGVDIYLAHLADQKIQPGEWIPIVFGPAAGGLLLLAGILALWRRQPAAIVATTVFLSSIVVGLLGIYFHLIRAALPAGPITYRLTTRLLVWGPPFLGPLMFVLVALFGISAVWREDPPDSGRLWLGRRLRIRLPLPKTDVYFLLVGSAAMVATVSAVFDHARTGWENANLWIPTVVGLFAAIVCFAIAVLRTPRRGDLVVYATAMAAMVITGLLGVWFHYHDNITSRGVIVAERFIRGAPIMAPLLYANVGLFGLVALLDPRSGTRRDRATAAETTTSAIG
ncbi:MAG: hypothetical protein KJ698_07550 [Actinobacteria bacterium]|nr:hypothetical protein [Actinomycetota bacterium]MBU1865479.1 hypothetical protein [Actinomycetota bacterium]